MTATNPKLQTIIDILLACCEEATGTIEVLVSQNVVADACTDSIEITVETSAGSSSSIDLDNDDILGHIMGESVDIDIDIDDIAEVTGLVTAVERACVDLAKLEVAEPTESPKPATMIKLPCGCVGVPIGRLDGLPPNFLPANPCSMTNHEPWGPAVHAKSVCATDQETIDAMLIIEKDHCVAEQARKLYGIMQS